MTVSETPVDGLMEPGVAAATRRRLEALGEAYSPLGQAALVLSATLDAGAGMAAAAMSKELRAILKELTPHDAGDDFQQLLDELQA